MLQPPRATRALVPAADALHALSSLCAASPSSCSPDDAFLLSCLILVLCSPEPLFSSVPATTLRSYPPPAPAPVPLLLSLLHPSSLPAAGFLTLSHALSLLSKSSSPSPSTVSLLLSSLRRGSSMRGTDPPTPHLPLLRKLHASFLLCPALLPLCLPHPALLHEYLHSLSHFLPPAHPNPSLPPLLTSLHASLSSPPYSRARSYTPPKFTLSLLLSLHSLSLPPLPAPNNATIPPPPPPAVPVLPVPLTPQALLSSDGVRSLWLGGGGRGRDARDAVEGMMGAVLESASPADLLPALSGFAQATQQLPPPLLAFITANVWPRLSTILHSDLTRFLTEAAPLYLSHFMSPSADAAHTFKSLCAPLAPLHTHVPSLVPPLQALFRSLLHTLPEARIPGFVEYYDNLTTATTIARPSFSLSLSASAFFSTLVSVSPRPPLISPQLVFGLLLSGSAQVIDAACCLLMRYSEKYDGLRASGEDVQEAINELNLFIWDFLNHLFLNKSVSADNTTSYLHHSLDKEVMEVLGRLGGGNGMGIVEGDEWSGYVDRFLEERNSEREKPTTRADLKNKIALKAKYAVWLETQGLPGVTVFLAKFVSKVKEAKEKPEKKGKGEKVSKKRPAVAEGGTLGQLASKSAKSNS
ncbi:hypothetical protein TeGR_g10509 [Tetraparma gracilis]|uniref:Uncharacterized protein n=1 Tax=Tetraparma gracilis TaxID=2962635 RepID=A0ABQ6N9R1_9STRA|nr:hypothetical protein TeGR_g10509 [Tetraparma gracilis]